MVVQRSSARAWRSGLASLVLLVLGGCADVEATEGELSEGETLEQFLDPAPRRDLGKGNGRDVITMGDSWMNNTLGTDDPLDLFDRGGIEGGLWRAGLRYRWHGVQGAKLLERSLIVLPPITTQFDDALRQNRDIKTVIMTGGGNDVLLVPGAQQDCLRGGATCRGTLQRIRGALTQLWERMAAAGVQDVVYIGYTEASGGAGAETTNATKNGVGEACAAMTSLRCHVIDSTPYVAASDLTDGIHPNRAANDRLAGVIIKYMEENGIRR